MQALAVYSHVQYTPKDFAIAWSSYTATTRDCKEFRNGDFQGGLKYLSCFCTLGLPQICKLYFCSNVNA